MTIEVWADVGGTFTDCIVRTEKQSRTTKVLSSGRMRVAAQFIGRNQFRIGNSPRVPSDFWTGALVESFGAVTAFDAESDTLTIRPSGNVDLSGVTTLQLNPQLEAPVLAARILLGVPLTTALPPLVVRMGTTRGTNALLTRAGAPTALLTTAGFGDVLLIGEQDRPELFDLAIKKPEPLTRCVVEIDERLDFSGNIIKPLDLEAVGRQLESLWEQNIQSLAICLMHAYLNDTHECQIEEIARKTGFTNVSRSSEVAPLIKLVHRAETTTLDAYLNPILQGYVARVWQQFGGADNCHLRLMTSSGNLVAPDSFRGRDSILSGPAGGVVALAEVAKQAGVKSAIGLDMGGTSTDVSRYQGKLGRRYESHVSGVRVVTPMMDIETVAAGGGSVCDYRDGRMTVGPDSAGADPGPACYGHGGPLTVTDLNVLLNRIEADRFPFPIDLNAAKERLQQIADQMPPSKTSNEALAEGFLEIAVTHMAEAVRTVSTAEGSDVRKMALVGFGGAAGQHLCQVANALGMKEILDHPSASVMSALGMGMASIGRVLTTGIYRNLDEVDACEIDQLAAELKTNTLEQLASEQTSCSPTTHLECDVRYQGTDSALALSLQPLETLRERFHKLHAQTFGYKRDANPIELVALRCEATLESSATSMSAETKPSESDQSDSLTKKLFYRGSSIEAALIDRSSLVAGDQIESPAIIVSDQSTLLVLPGWRGQVESGGLIRLRSTHAKPLRSTTAETNADDPVLLEVIGRRLQGIADAMGEVLRRTAISVNIKQRRDYSCAVFRGDGSLIANAPHVPVHLGAMGHTVRRMISVYPNMSPGDCFLSNDPFAGGSHLPDITVVTPVFCGPDSSSPDFFVASRAHHAEVGGRTPGSMPPDGKSLPEEGVVIRDFALLKNGVSYQTELHNLLSSGPYPSRNADENIADIAAQQAAGIEGANGLMELVADYDRDSVDRLMGRILQVAAESTERFIQTLPTEPLSFSDTLDDGTKLVVSLQRKANRLAIDFDGTAGVHPLCFNATPSIVTAAVLYVLKCVSDSDLPLCDGVMRNIDLHIPQGLLNPPVHLDPAKCAAVVAGNVETSQRVVDILLGALGIAAASQGTMNNLLLGDETFGYYETICGGSGATADAPGVSAVHTHMTNTRITDPEVFENRLPARLCRFAIRHGSGGDGKNRGGDGIIREIEFLKQLTVSLITNRRSTSPYGMRGGDSGQRGVNKHVQSNRTNILPPATCIEVEAGDRLIIETPGGGGWGL